MIFCGPGGIRTLDLLSAIDKQVGEKSRLLRLFRSKITIQLAALVAGCSSISVPELFLNCTRSVPDMHRYEARKGNPKPCPKGEIKVTDDVSDYP
jgi:hypothetical protein